MSNIQLELFKTDLSSLLALEYVDTGVSAGFPSPADDFIEQSLDLNKELIKNAPSTFYARVKGDSMKNAGIDNGDLIIIDKSIEPANGKIAVCFLDGEFTLKRLKIENHVCWLMPENENYKPIKATKDNDFLVWGIVLHVIKTF
jgi:DNA polymerase V